MYRPRRRAFTLIEVLVVVAIIALLLAILMPSLKRARGSARASVCASQLHQFAVAMGAYQAEFDNYIPRGGTFTSRHWVMLIPREIGDDKIYDHVNQVPVETMPIFSCPERMRTLPEPFIDYVINAFDVTSSYNHGWGEVQEASKASDYKHPSQVLLLGDAADECSTVGFSGTLAFCPDDPIGASNGTLRENRENHPAAMQLTNLNNFQADEHASLDRMDVFHPDHIQPSGKRRAGTVTHLRSYSNWLFADGHVEAVKWLNGKRTEEQWLRMYGVKDPQVPTPNP
jgi:prepilin-type N-terminal cleavage/methylation domain-containing protein/prepilin-type processing-associated H-X9-DG protein